jgi:hypothetical protein
MFLRPKPFLAVLAGLTLPASALFAQVPLTPATAAQPAQPAPPTPAAPPSFQGEKPPERIQVQDLASLNPNEAGLIDEAHGALGQGMWGGTSLGLIARGIPLLPNSPSWRALRSLELRLLESPASLPDGKPSGEAMVSLRAGKLEALGAADAAAQLLAHVPGPQLTPTQRRLLVDAQLLSGNYADACAQEPALRAALQGDNYAQQVQVFCQFVAGKGNEAGLGIDLLRDQKLKDPAFFAAADTLSGLPPSKQDWAAQVSPVTLAMAIQAKLPLTEAGVASAPPAALPTLVRDKDLALETRIAATERAVALGLILPDALRELYDAAPLDIGTASTETGKTAKSRAILYKAVQAQPAPAQKAELIERALAGDPAGAPLVYAPAIVGLQADTELVSFAPWAIRALLSAGQFEAARPWFGILRADSVATGGQNATAALKPLARLAGLADPLTAADLEAWHQARNDSPADGAKRTLLLMCLISALGDTPPDEAWLPLLDGQPVITGKVSRSALSVGLMTAAASGRRGETALYTLLSLGESRDTEPGEFARLVASLKAVKLDGDARALAVELALAYGI